MNRSARWSIPLTFTTHAEERLTRLEGIEKESIIRDIKKNIMALKKELNTENYMVVGQIAKYILSSNFSVITIMYRRPKKKLKFRRQYANLDKSYIFNLIQQCQKL